MNCNLESFRMKRFLGTAHNDEQQPVFTIIDFRLKGAKYPESFYFYSDKTFRMFKNQLRGEVDYSETVAFEDIGKVMYRISPHGFTVMTADSKDITLIYPGKFLAAWMDYHMSLDDEYVILEPERIKELDRLHKPRTRLVFSSDKTKENMQRMHKSPWWPTLKQCIQNEMRVMRNNSDGERLVLHVVQDGTPDSFYFYSSLQNEPDNIFKGKKNWEGGWIKHRLYSEGFPTDEYNYSSHH